MCREDEAVAGCLWPVAGGDGWRRRNPPGPSLGGAASAWRKDRFRFPFFFYSPNCPPPLCKFPPPLFLVILTYIYR